MQADIARLRVLVVGVGSVGLEVAVRLVASGIEHVGVMDFDSVELVNLDRLIGATRLDALLRTPKVEVARRLMRQAATAEHPVIRALEASICEPTGRSLALDYDVIFSCVDRPWPRAVLNALGYGDLIPSSTAGSTSTPSRRTGCETRPGGHMSFGPDGPALRATASSIWAWCRRTVRDC